MNKLECEQKFSSEFKSTAYNLGATQSNIMRLLRSLDLVGWSTHEESGKVDRKAFVRYGCGSTNIFSKRELKDAERSAVSVLIDCSGSMGGRRLDTAQSVAIQIAKILNRASVAFKITGFSGFQSGDGINTTGATSNAVFFTTEETELIEFKTWGESLQRASAKMGSINQWGGGGTPDYSGVSLALEDLNRRSEQRKILFVITDADGYTKAHMQYLQSLADKLNVVLIAIGIGSTDVKDCFTNAEDVKRVDELASATFNKLLKQLKV